MSKINPLVSIIVPVYNVESTFARCLASLRAQTYQNLEIILIDDGSTDRSGELCDEAAGADARVQVIHQNNQGLSAARNAGLDIIHGDFVMFVDSDDTVEPDTIEALSSLIQKTKAQLAICSFAEVFPSGARKPFVSESDQTQVYDTATALTHMLCEDGFTMSAWGKLYARELFRDVRFPVGKLYEDVGTTYKTVLDCTKIAFLPQAKYNYYQNTGSIIHQQFSMQKMDLIELTDQMCDQIAAYLNSTHSLGDQERKNLELAVKKRRLHARFSILRQMVMVNYRTFSGDRDELLLKQKAIVGYLRRHKTDILQNPLSSRRDKFAMRTLLLGLPIFKLAWQVYMFCRVNS